MIQEYEMIAWCEDDDEEELVLHTEDSTFTGQNKAESLFFPTDLFRPYFPAEEKC
jgi:hypothetical protein